MEKIHTKIFENKGIYFFSVNDVYGYVSSHVFLPDDDDNDYDDDDFRQLVR
jgi:hypothetical protein